MAILSASVLAAEIREFDLRTIERLGNELTRVSQSPEKGATTSTRKRARQTAMAALKSKLFNIHYDFIVLEDPNGSGFLVYALEDPSPKGYHKVFFATSQAVGTRPVETLVCASNLMKMPIAVATPPHGQAWFIKNGKITKSSSRK
jgi:hypothetical protein